MTFYEYIQGFVNDQTPLGELATWVNQDETFPKHEKIAENILSYFQQLTNLEHGLLEIVKRSLSLYSEIK